jgi:Rrf2 family protein
MSNIVKISEAASLGLHALIVLARDPKNTFSAGEISQILKVSEAHLAKVMQRLVKVGLVHSARGPHGGFVLGKPADQISLLDIYEAIEGPIAEISCLLDKPVCKNGECVFGDLIRNINHQVAEHLAKTKLSTQHV